MPIRAELKRAPDFWLLTTGGSLTVEEIERLVHEVEWKGVRDVLWDLRNLREAPGSSGELRDAAQMVAKSRALFEGGKVAILVAREHDFGNARMFQVFAEGSGVEYRVFRDHDAALEFLGEAASE